jgi:hypothetical protein
MLDEDRLESVKAYHSSDSALRAVASKVITAYLQKSDKRYNKCGKLQQKCQLPN